MKHRHFKAIPLLVALGVIGFGSRQSNAASDEAQVLGVSQWLGEVADLSKAAQFYHDTLGLEFGGNTGETYKSFRKTNAFLWSMYRNKGEVKSFIVHIPGADMGIEIGQWHDVAGKQPATHIQDPGAGYLILRTSNIEDWIPRIAKSGARVLTSGGQPVTVTAADGSTHRVLWLRDPDGYFVALEQASSGSRPASSAQFDGADAGFAVQDMDEALHFYRDVLGFQAETADWAADKDQLRAYGIRSAQYRTSVLRLPGSNVAIHLTQFKGLPRTPLHGMPADPNSFLLRMRVRGMDALAAKLKAAGTKIISESGKPYSAAGGRWFMVEGPDNVYVQLVEIAPVKATNPGPGP